MNLTLSHVASVLATALTLGLSAPAPVPARLLVANQGDATMSIVDLSTGKLTGSVAEGFDKVVAHEVATSRDGRTAYLPIYASSGVGKPGIDGHIMLRIDIATGKITGTLDFGHGVRPHCVVLDPVSGLLYVTTELDKAITIVDPATFKIVGTIPTTQEQSHMLAISHDGKRGYTANVGPGTVSVLDLKGRKTVAVVPISANTQRISVSNDDKWVFTADQTTPRLAVIDASANQVKSWITLPAVGYGTAPTKDGRNLLVTLIKASQLAVVDLKTMQVTHTMDVCANPQEVLPSPDGKMAYVSCIGGHQVAAVDLGTWKVTGMIDVGERADGMALAIPQ